MLEQETKDVNKWVHYLAGHIKIKMEEEEGASLATIYLALIHLSSYTLDSMEPHFLNMTKEERATGMEFLKQFTFSALQKL